MSNQPPSGDQANDFDPLSPMASDFNYSSGAAFSTPDPFIKADSPETQSSGQPDFANPTPDTHAQQPPSTPSPAIDVNPYGGTDSPQGQSPWTAAPGNPSPPPPPPYGAPGPYGAPQSYGAAPYGPYAPGPYIVQGQQPRVNPSAVTGMILSIVSVIFCIFSFFLSIPGIILGIVGLIQTRNEPQRYSGGPLAITAIVVGAISVLFYGWGIAAGTDYW